MASTSITPDELAGLRRVVLFMIGLRKQGFHGEVRYKYFDGRVTNVTTERSDKVETLQIPSEADLQRVVDGLFQG